MSQLYGRPKKFEYFEHPADIGLRVYGRDLPSLFENAAAGLYDVLGLSINYSSRDYRKKIRLSSRTIEELLVCFLNEILFLSVKSHLIFQKFSINIKCSKNKNKLECEMTGKQISEVNREVKAATYHKTGIVKTGEYYVTDIILDV